MLPNLPHVVNELRERNMSSLPWWMRRHWIIPTEVNYHQRRLYYSFLTKTETSIHKVWHFQYAECMLPLGKLGQGPLRQILSSNHHTHEGQRQPVNMHWKIESLSVTVMDPIQKHVMSESSRLFNSWGLRRRRRVSEKPCESRRQRERLPSHHCWSCTERLKNRRGRSEVFLVQPWLSLLPLLSPGEGEHFAWWMLWLAKLSI